MGPGRAGHGLDGVAQPGLADERVEGAAYDFTVEVVNGKAVDGGPVAGDSFSLTLHGADLMFDGHTFAPGIGGRAAGAPERFRRVAWTLSRFGPFFPP